MLATQTFLHDFRLCPDQCGMTLDKWRHLLWCRALGEQYEHIAGCTPYSKCFCHYFPLVLINTGLYTAGDIYTEWLRLRYYCLAIAPDVLSLLYRLRQHYMLGLITNGPSCAQWEKVERLDLRHYFDCILVSGDLPWEKPHQKIFLEACHYLGVQPWQCIMVGDKLETDIQGAIEASLGATVWVPLCTEHPSILKPCPDFTLASITDLPCLLPSVPKSLIRSRFNATFPDIEDCSSNSSDGS